MLFNNSSHEGNMLDYLLHEGKEKENLLSCEFLCFGRSFFLTVKIGSFVHVFSFDSFF